jgi:subtilisin
LVAPRPRVAASVTLAASVHQSSTDLIVTVQDATGAGIKGAQVIAFTDFANRAGGEGTSDANGAATISLSPLPPAIERLYINVDAVYWSGLFFNVDTSSHVEVRLHKIDLSIPDILTSLYQPAMTDGQGACIGIIDAGVDFTHPDLVAARKVNRNMVSNAPDDDGSPGAHATHVAGIIGGRGAAPNRKLGIAPAAELCSYRVFPTGEESQASNFDIVSSIEQAVADGCQLINMSLGGGAADPGTEKAIDFAWQNGVVCVVANGNDHRGPVSNPAAYSPCVAVSAFGRPGACPPDTVSVASVAAPFDTTGKFEIGDFSNVGADTDLTGGGVGVISTVLNGQYGVMDGTSMACPAVTARAAVILAKAGTLTMPPDANRSAAIRKVLESTAVAMGFGSNFEGHGALP